MFQSWSSWTGSSANTCAGAMGPEIGRWANFGLRRLKKNNRSYGSLEVGGWRQLLKPRLSAISVCFFASTQAETDWDESDHVRIVLIVQRVWNHQPDSFFGWKMESPLTRVIRWWIIWSVTHHNCPHVCGLNVYIIYLYIYMHIYIYIHQTNITIVNIQNCLVLQNCLAL